MALDSGQGVVEELLKTFEECREPDWDGYGAQPVLDTTYQLAQNSWRHCRQEHRHHLLAPNPTVTSL
jgi:hypothetical protein